MKNPICCRAARGTASAYAALLLSLYLLAVPEAGYSEITEFKYALFLWLSSAYLAAALVLRIMALARGERGWSGGKLTPAVIAASLYLLFTAVSAALSDYGAVAVAGGSRREGLLTLALYVLVFLFLLSDLRPRRWMLWLFGVSVSLCCVLAMIQFTGRNPLALYPEGHDYFGANIYYAGSYAGTLGNTALLSAALSFAAPAFLMAVIKRKSRWELLFLIPFALSAYVVWALRVAAGIFALGGGLVLMLPVMASRGGNTRKERAARRMSWVVVCSAGALFFLLLWFYPGPSNGPLYEISETLHGRAYDSFGSGRIYIWRNALELFQEKPLFGGGPDTLQLRGIADYIWHRERDGAAMSSVITSAHNEYLNILVNQGAFALGAYLALLIASVLRFYRRPGSRYAVCGGAVICYSIGAFFGVSMPITAPYLWLALAVLNASPPR